jgi:hypothetical protein
VIFGHTDSGAMDSLGEQARKWIETKISIKNKPFVLFRALVAQINKKAESDEDLGV